MNHSLVKLVDATLLPAAVLVVAKFVGLALTITLFKLPWNIVQVADGFGFASVTPVVKFGDLVTVSTYSDLIMYLIVAVAFSFILTQVTFLHQKQIKPSLLVKLSNANLLGLVKSSYDIYHHASIWLFFLWIANFTILLNIGMGKTAIWVGVISFVSSVIFTTILLQDVYKEIRISRKNLGKQAAF